MSSSGFIVKVTDYPSRRSYCAAAGARAVIVRSRLVALTLIASRCPVRRGSAQFPDSSPTPRRRCRHGGGFLSRMSSNQRTKNVAGIELSPLAVSTPKGTDADARRLELDQPAADVAVGRAGRISSTAGWWLTRAHRSASGIRTGPNRLMCSSTERPRISRASALRRSCTFALGRSTPKNSCSTIRAVLPAGDPMKFL